MNNDAYGMNRVDKRRRNGSEEVVRQGMER